jgi:hypothetical protein
MAHLAQRARPAGVTLAVRLLYVTLAVAFLNTLVWQVIAHGQYDIRLILSIFIVATYAVVTGLELLLVLKMAQGSRWARRLWVLFILVALAATLCSMGENEPPGLNTPAGIASLVGYATWGFRLLALVLLHRGDAREYFAEQGGPQDEGPSPAGVSGP